MSVHSGQTVGRIKIKLGMQVGLGPGHNLLDADTAPPPPKGRSPPNFRPISVAANGCMDQDATFELDNSKTTGYLDIWHDGSS